MIHIACSADGYYMPHCAAMLNSLFTYNSGEHFCIHFLCRDISDDNHRRLESMVAEHNADLQLHIIDDKAMQGFPTDKFHASCWYRILLPQLLPKLERILYLDADMIVLGTITPLWEMSLNGNLFAAVVNPLYPFMPNRIVEQLQLSLEDEYLNSGVLLMDLERMRDSELVERLREYATVHPENIWPEQDALSVVCRGKWQPLPPRWNAQSTLFDLPVGQLPFSAGEIGDARRQPVIVHFIGPHKPWHYLCRHPFRQHYHRHRRATPWGECELEGRSLGNFLLKPLPLGRQLQLRKLDKSCRALTKKVIRIAGRN